MGRKKKTGILTGSKGAAKIENTTSRKLPTIYNSNTVLRKIDSLGNVLTERYFDSEGYAKYDIDYTNHGNSKLHPIVPHIHIWSWDGNKGKRGK